MPFWVEFESPIKVSAGEGRERMTNGACLNGCYKVMIDYEKLKDEVASYAGLFGPVKRIDVIPYGAYPRLDGERGFGDFCFDPWNCRGSSSCPRSYACSE